jgi:protein-disulfide isomerase
LFLSPDGRFLTSELFDTAVDPVAEERQREQVLMAGLMPNTGSSRGPLTAPVTIVEFSDFECPFCRRFAEIARQVLPEEKDQVRIVFHHFPLPMHPWARAAAEGAACAQLQSSEAFWSIHDQLFQNQQSITPENVKQKLRDFAQASQTIDLPKFQSCLENQMSSDLYFKT